LFFISSSLKFWSSKGIIKPSLQISYFLFTGEYYLVCIYEASSSYNVSYSYLTGDVSIHFELARCVSVWGLALTGFGAAIFIGHFIVGKEVLSRTQLILLIHILSACLLFES
jgi:hypothetical protein